MAPTAAGLCRSGCAAVSLQSVSGQPGLQSARAPFSMHRRLIDLVDTLTNITKDLPHCGRSGFGPTCVNAFAGWFCAKYNLASERFVSGCQIRFPNQHGFQCFANSAAGDENGHAAAGWISGDPKPRREPTGACRPLRPRTRSARVGSGYAFGVEDGQRIGKRRL